MHNSVGCTKFVEVIFNYREHKTDYFFLFFLLKYVIMVRKRNFSLALLHTIMVKAKKMALFIIRG